MNINGKEIADEIKNELKGRVLKLPRKLRFDIVYVGKDPVIENFLRIKRRTGEDIGVETVLHHFPATIFQTSLTDEVQKLTENKNSDGIIIQLPLPSTINAEAILALIPQEKDIDALSKNTLLLFEQGKPTAIPPVVGAIAEIIKRNAVSLVGKNAIVLGNGLLVGKPAAIWLKQNGANVTILDKDDGDPTPHLQKADIIVSGTGIPNIIKPEMIREGVILFDAGASEESGEIRGDADPLCSDKCSLFTPVPGGIGPITVVMLFKNLLDAVEKKAV